MGEEKHNTDGIKLEEEIKKKLDEIARKADEENRTKETAEQKKLDEERESKEEFEREKKVRLEEAQEEVDEFEPHLLPLRRDMMDKQIFYAFGGTKFTIVATEDKKIKISTAGSRISGKFSIYDLANNQETQPYILDLLRSFIIQLKQFESYYADNVERHMKR